MSYLFPSHSTWRCVSHVASRPLAGFRGAAPEWEGRKEEGMEGKERNGRGGKKKEGRGKEVMGKEGGKGRNEKRRRKRKRGEGKEGKVHVVQITRRQIACRSICLLKSHVPKFYHHLLTGQGA